MIVWPQPKKDSEGGAVLHHHCGPFSLMINGVARDWTPRNPEVMAYPSNTLSC